MSDRERGVKTSGKSRAEKNEKAPAAVPPDAFPLFPASLFILPLLVPCPLPARPEKEREHS